MTAAAPAQTAKERAFGRLSKELAELVVVPMTWRRASEASARCDLVGERSGVLLLRNGEGEGVSLMPAPQAGLIIRGLFGVSDMAAAGDRESVGGSSEGWHFQRNSMVPAALLR